MVNAASHLLHRLIVLLVALGIVLSLSLMGPQPSLADKLPQPLVLASETVGATVISVYATDSATQPDAVKALLKSSKSYYKQVGGFASFAILASTDGSRILVLTQWDDATSYDAYQSALATDSTTDYSQYYKKYTKAWSTSEIDQAEPMPQFTEVFTVERTVAPPGLKPIIAGENSLVQVRGLDARDPATLDAVMIMATTALDRLPSLYPSPRSAVLLRGTMRPYVAVVANWGNLSELGDLAQLPPLSIDSDMSSAVIDEIAADGVGVETAVNDTVAADIDGPVASESVIENLAPTLDRVIPDDHFYQVVKVIAPKLEKYPKS